MTDRFAQIRRLLDQLEIEQTAAPAILEADSLETELISVIQDIVDYLQPLLTPYQAAFYWYLFRHSVANTGTAYVRVSTRGLQKGVVQSARSEKVSQSQVKDLLSGLENVGAIRKESEPNREGTLYRVLLPDQIESCKRYRETVRPSDSPVGASELEADYYNVRDNRHQVYERDEYHCRYCGKQLTALTVTLDHVTAVVEGGDNSFDNLVTSCLGCNSRKNKRALGDFLADEDRT